MQPLATTLPSPSNLMGLFRSQAFSEWLQSLTTEDLSLAASAFEQAASKSFSHFFMRRQAEAEAERGEVA